MDWNTHKAAFITLWIIGAVALALFPFGILSFEWSYSIAVFCILFIAWLPIHKHTVGEPFPEIWE